VASPSFRTSSQFYRYRHRARGELGGERWIITAKIAVFRTDAQLSCTFARKIAILLGPGPRQREGLTVKPTCE